MSSIIWYPGHDLFYTNIVRAEGSHVFDASGRRWLDLESGVWATCIGQTHPRVASALANQFAAIAHTGFNYTVPVVRRALEAALGVLGLGRGGVGTLLCSGSEAVEYCVRLIIELMPRPKLLTMADSYFGAYGSAHTRIADRWSTFDWLSCSACAAGDVCGDLDAHLAAIPFDEIGTFVFEPGSSSGFVRFPPASLVERISRRVQAAGGFVIVNEVTTGVGRTGKWFGFQHYDIQPDAVALGKGIGGGYPVAVAAFGERVASKIEGPPAYAQSHQNDPLGAAVLLAVIGAIEDEGLIERGREIGAYLKGEIEGLQSRTGAFSSIRGRGPTIAVDLRGDAEEATRVHHSLAEAGYLVGRRPGTATLRFDPPLNVQRADIDAFLAAFRRILAK